MNRRNCSREKILETAKDLFYQAGYQATSVDDILRAAGVSRSNFYYHFPTKEALAFAVLELRAAEFETLIGHTLQNSSFTPSQRLERFFTHITLAQEKLKQSAGCPFGNFTAALPTEERDSSYERFRQRLSALFHEMEDALRGCLVEGIAAGELRADISPAEMAAFLTGSVQGLLILAKAHRDVSLLPQGFSVAQRLLQSRGK
jgi:AcrR family transcriptional regulator